METGAEGIAWRTKERGWDHRERMLAPWGRSCSEEDHLVMLSSDVLIGRLGWTANTAAEGDHPELPRHQAPGGCLARRLGD